MDDVEQMSIRADPTTRENKQGKKKRLIFYYLFYSLFIPLKEKITVLHSKLRCYLLVIII